MTECKHPCFRQDHERRRCADCGTDLPYPDSPVSRLAAVERRLDIAEAVVAELIAASGVGPGSMKRTVAVADAVATCPADDGPEAA